MINYLYNTLGITNILKDIFPEYDSDIKNLSAFFLSNSSPGYLYTYWHDEHFIKEGSQLDSKSISSLYHNLGEREKNGIYASMGQ